MSKITDFNLVFEPNINNVNIKDIEVNIYKNIRKIKKCVNLTYCSPLSLALSLGEGIT